MKTIVGLFDEKKDARAVCDRLEAAGVPKNRLHTIQGGMLHGSGFDKLVELGVSSTEAESFAEGLRRGGEVVACVCNESEVSRLLPYFQEGRMADLDRRAARWRTQGWNRYDRNAHPLGGDAALAERQFGAGEVVIPIVEEKAMVGKREVEGGHVKVETSVREVPVAETIGLRKEHVEVERRPADRPLTAADQPFQDRTIDVAAKSEEAVVAKQARVVEEVVVKKDVQQTQQQVRDTVKKTEVKVDRTAERTSRPSRESLP